MFVDSDLKGEQGFTLLEVLMALIIFALISVVCYTALGPAGEGFKQLQDSRDDIEKSSWLGKQLRMDIAAVTASSLTSLQPIQLQNDSRGDMHADHLTLLVRQAGRSGLTLVRYSLDEENGVLLRESRMAWARDRIEPDRMVLGELSSFEVEVMNAQGQWKHQLENQDKTKPIIWPKALRVTVVQAGKQRKWLLSVAQAL